MAKGKRNSNDILSNLQELKSELEMVKKVEFKGVNTIDMVGMANQETKHSKLLTNLFNPNYKHNFNYDFINLFIERLYNYITKSDERTSKPKQNEDILNSQKQPKLQDVQRLKGLFSNIELVRTEYYIDGKKANQDRNRRIDILIESKKAVLIIENKVESDTHTNQLSAYETYADLAYPNKEKIFVFLSPCGLLPYSNKPVNYCDRWCVFDYLSIKDIVKNILKGVKNNKYNYSSKLEKIKIEIILEDYIEMIDTEILKTNPDILVLAQDIADNLIDEYQLISAYFETATLSKVRELCKKELGALDTTVAFTTKQIKDFFEKHDGKGKYKKDLAHIIIQNVGAKKGVQGYEILLHLFKPRNGQWTNAQKRILGNNPTYKDMAPIKIELLSKEKVGYKFEDVAQEIKDNLSRFLDQLKLRLQ